MDFKLIKKLFWSILLQALGTGSSLLLVFLITRYYGVAMQGQFAIVKSWIDVCVVVAFLGLPQSYVYAVNQLGVPLGKLKSASLKYLFIVFPIVLLVSFIWFLYSEKTINLSLIELLFMSGAITFLVGHGLFRGLYLTNNDGKVFAIISALPALLLFVCTLLNYQFFSYSLYIQFNYFVSALLAFTCMLFLLRNYKSNNSHITEQIIPWGKIINNGLGVFVQSLALVLLPMLTYWLMLKYGFTQAQVGLFNIALYSYMIFALPLNMVSPIFFNKWSKIDNTDILNKEVNHFLFLGVVLLPILFILYYLMPTILVYAFGKQVTEAIKVSQILLLAMIPLYLNNILSCAISARGFFQSIAGITVIKMLFCIMCVFIFLNFGEIELENIAISWVMADYLFLIMAFYFKRIKLCV